MNGPAWPSGDPFSESCDGHQQQRCDAGVGRKFMLSWVPAEGRCLMRQYERTGMAQRKPN
jgi:hypothetical protein